jgi:hypothetical protein
MRVTAFDIEGIHVVAHCITRDSKWIANVRAKQESVYLTGATYRLEAEDSSMLAALTQEALRGLDEIVGRFIAEIRVYETALKTHTDAVRGKTP